LTERSMRWPIQNEFVVGMSRSNRPIRSNSVAGSEELETNKQWIAMRAGLNPDAFEKLPQPFAIGVLGVSLQTQSAVNADASYYDAIMKAVDASHSPLRKLTDIVLTSMRSFVVRLETPLIRTK